MYQQLASQSDAEALIASATPAWLFKHSTACPTSAAAIEEFSSFLVDHPDAPAGVVVIQQHRALSNWVATRLGYVHQSPQLFLVQAGKVRWAASHWSITATAMRSALGKSS